MAEHILRHTFATMMIAGGTDVRTVASYLGHASVSMTLNIYADVDAHAKKAAVSKVQDCFDMDFDLDDGPAAAPAPGISFTTASDCQTCPLARLQRAGAGVEPALAMAMLQAAKAQQVGAA